MNITFRPHAREDIVYRVKWLNNPANVLYVLDDPSYATTHEEQNLWFGNYEKSLTSGQKKFFTICDGDDPVGFMGLSNIDSLKKTADVFIMIGEEKYRGKGVGKISLEYLIDFAFKELSLDRLTLEVDRRNLSAVNLYTAFGFQKVGENEKEFKMELYAPGVVCV